MSRRAKSGKGPTAKSAAARTKIRDVFVARPFEGLVDEPQWIALRELIPAASAPLRLVKEYAARYPDRSVSLATILPLAMPVLNRADGQVLLGLQCHSHASDVSRDYAATILAALETPPGESVDLPAQAGPGPRLQDLIEPCALEITLHSKFDFWLDGTAMGDDTDVRASMDRANASLYPTEVIAAAPAAYWCRLPERAHVRWVLPEGEDLALDALSRVTAAGGLPLGAGTKFAGMFRAHGRLIPVWDLPAAPEAAEWESEVGAFAQRYAAGLAVQESLSVAERRARQGLLGRQIALR